MIRFCRAVVPIAIAILSCHPVLARAEQFEPFDGECGGRQGWWVSLPDGNEYVRERFGERRFFLEFTGPGSTGGGYRIWMSKDGQLLWGTEGDYVCSMGTAFCYLEVDSDDEAYSDFSTRIEYFDYNSTQFIHLNDMYGSTVSECRNSDCTTFMDKKWAKDEEREKLASDPMSHYIFNTFYLYDCKSERE